MWQGIHGHDAIVEQFRRSQAAGRLASSFLFLGPSGVGKRTFAEKLAKALLCLESADSSLEPCDQCDSCRLMDAVTHPDVDVVGVPAGKRQLPLELFLGRKEHRNQEGLCHNIAMRPMLSRRRVAIIDDADHLTTESANCLLKTLEEPPAGAVIILIGTSRGRQLPTILSRTQLVRFAPLSPETVSRIVLARGLAEDEQAAHQLAERCNGSLKRAEDLGEFSSDEVQQRLLRHFALEEIDGSRLVAELNDVVLQGGKEAEARRKRLRLVLDLAIEHWRSELKRLSSAGVSEEEALIAQNRVLDALDRCIAALAEVDRNANPATLIECWVDDLCRIFSPPVSVGRQ